MNQEKAEQLAEAIFHSAIESGSFEEGDSVEISPNEWELRFMKELSGVRMGVLVDLAEGEPVAHWNAAPEGVK